MRVSSAEDVAYVRRSYLNLEAVAAAEGLSRAELADLITSHVVPGPAYVLPSDEPMFPRDLCALLRSAGTAVEVPGHFRSRFVSIARCHGPLDPERIDAEWESYLSGAYGVCLRQVTPETIFLKEWLVSAIEADLRAPDPESPTWRRRLCEQVEGLDALLRPFASCDRVRFGRPTSRERCIDVPRARYPWLL
jgi:hypothetical protein